MTARLNLVPASHLLARRRARRVQTWAAACGAYALVMVVLVVGVQVARVADSGDLQRGLMEVSHMREKMQLQLKHLTGERTELTQQYAAARAVGVQPDWSVPLRLLGAEGAEGIVLTRLEMAPVFAGAVRPTLLTEPQGYQVIVEGRAVSEATLADLIRSVERLGPFSRVRREASTMESFAGKDDAVRFRLVCEVGETKPPAAAGGAGS